MGTLHKITELHSGDEKLVRQPAVVWERIVLFGDSLTELAYTYEGGWGTLLADRYRRRVDIVLRGYGGYNTRLARAALLKHFTKDNTKGILAFVVFIGAFTISIIVHDAILNFFTNFNQGSNDAATDVNTYVPISEFEQNLHFMIEHVQQIGIGKDKIIFITPPPLINGRIPGWDSCLVELYAQAMNRVSRNESVEIVNLYYEMMGKVAWRDYFRDGVHFNRAGSEFLYNMLVPLLDKRAQPAVQKFPSFAILNYRNPEKHIGNWVVRNV